MGIEGEMNNVLIRFCDYADYLSIGYHQTVFLRHFQGRYILLLSFSIISSLFPLLTFRPLLFGCETKQSTSSKSFWKQIFTG